MTLVRSTLIALAGVSALACATPPPAPPVQVSSLEPAAGERIAVDQALVLIDTSSSVSDEATRVARSFIAGMPEGSYEAGAVNFGGYARETLELGHYDRLGFETYAGSLSSLNEGTPIHSAFTEAGQLLNERKGRAAVLLISDGLPTDEIGRDAEASLSHEAVESLVSLHGGEVCVHTVQIGDDPTGTAFLQSLSQSAGCGTHRSAAQLGDEAGYHDLARAMFVAEAQEPLPPVAAGPDSDADGVVDAADRCPDTLRGAPVDARGCWSLPGMNFATNSAALETAGRDRLDQEVLPVLEKNPGVRVRIEGHTDDRGSDVYNQQLSEQRAESVRRYLVSRGVSAERLEARGFGETRPAAPNDTADNLRRNRRIELQVAR